jgi:hypothetical protein
MSDTSLPIQKATSLAKAAWAVAAGLAAVAVAIFTGGVNYAGMNARLDKIEQHEKKFEAYQNLKSTFERTSRYQVNTDCPPGYVMVGVTVGSENFIVRCGKL